MKVKHNFKTRTEAVEYLENRGWVLSTLFPATGTAVLSSPHSNDLRGVRNILCGGKGRKLGGKWVIERDQNFLKSL